MTHVATALLSLGGFALLFLAMARHQQDWLRRKLPDPQSRRLRRAGFALLSIAFLIAGLGLGWGYGSIAWFGWLSAGAVTIVTLNCNRERILARVRP
ncbi:MULTISPECIES: DUF3325 domain-containing protein [Sphingobium]|jgi:hypothetical protein|uniref:DUF3325 domain-containing protein n=1 Tax=Sphingobium yanoikuyae TaxID=13690 RepID=A0A0J9D6A1_SPHYA|nr:MULTISPECIES: DUF3325 domain-containing protein [Sphingobium]ATP19369.1 DUF3325 domain-containing protein [Sphingobium yanoikuyae]KMW32719.1 membrane protein [Sphingobium yanoikuyae]